MGNAQTIETPPLEESAVVDKRDFLYIGVRVYVFLLLSYLGKPCLQPFLKLS